MESNDQIAVFIDIENVIGFCGDLNLPIELNDVFKKLNEEGRVLIRRSFGDIGKSVKRSKEKNKDVGTIDTVRRMLQENLILHEDIRYRSGGFKNSADIRLAVEAMDTLFSLTNINKFAFITGDSDYTYLFSKLKERNKYIIGITGSKKWTNDVYIKSCDTIFYFDEISRTAGITTKISEKSSVAAEIGNIKEEYVVLLTKAIQNLVEKGGRTLGANIVPEIRKSQSDFDPKRAGFSSFRGLVEYAEKNGKVFSQNHEGGDILVLLTTAKPVSVEQNTGNNLELDYRLYIEERLKCPLPLFSERETIYKETSNIIKNEEYTGITIQDLSYQVFDTLNEIGSTITQPQVFKLLYSLLIADCFEVTGGGANSRIENFTVSFSKWDDSFVKNTLLMMKYETELNLDAAALSVLFYGNDNKTKKIEELLNEVEEELE